MGSWCRFRKNKAKQEASNYMFWKTSELLWYRLMAVLKLTSFTNRVYIDRRISIYHFWSIVRKSNKTSSRERQKKEKRQRRVIHPLQFPLANDAWRGQQKTRLSLDVLSSLAISHRLLSRTKLQLLVGRLLWLLHISPVPPCGARMTEWWPKRASPWPTSSEKSSRHI